MNVYFMKVIIVGTVKNMMVVVLHNDLEKLLLDGSNIRRQFTERIQ